MRITYNLKAILFVTFYLIYFQVDLFAQDIRVPYFNNGKYGIVDEDQLVILSPFYEEVVIHSECKLIAVLKDEKWAIYNFDGKKIIDHIIEVKEKDRKYGVRGPDIDFIEYRRPKEFNGRSNPNLIYVLNKKLNTIYYLSNAKFKESYKNYKYDPYRTYIAKHPVLSRYRVDNFDDSVNVIDEFGNEVLDSSVNKARVLNEKLISVSKDKLFALYDGSVRISEFKYNEIKQTEIKNIFIGKSYKKNGAYRRSYDLIDGEGKVVFTSNTDYDIMNNYIIHCLGNHCKILDEKLNVVQDFQNCNASWLRLSETPLIKLKSKNHYGVCDLQGNLALDTIYNSIKTNDSFLECTIAETHSVLDSNLNLLIENDSVLTLNATDRSDRYVYTQYDSNKILRRGLLNGKNDKLINIHKEEFKTFPCVDYVMESNSSNEFTLRNIADGEIIYDGIADYIRVNCTNQSYEIKDEFNRITKDFNGKTLYSSIDLSIYRKHKVVKDRRGAALTDLDGNVVIDSVFKSIRVITDPVTKMTAYFCTGYDKSISNSVVYNDNLEIISQPGYSISSNWVNYMIWNPGRIFVRNNEDVSNNEYDFRSGIIDFNGNWVLTPSNSMFRFINENLFVLREKGVEHLMFYDANGQQLYTGKYHFIHKNISQLTRQNRIAIAALYDNDLKKEITNNEDISKYNISAIKNYDDEITRIRNNTRGAIGENNPGVRYGYINDLGFEAIPTKFLVASNFDHTLPQAKVKVLDDDNKIRQCLIDTSGNITFSLPYENYLSVSKGYYKCGNNGDYKLVDSTGTEMFTNSFTDLRGSHGRSNIISGKDKEGCSVIDLKNKQMHRVDVKGTIELSGLSEEFIIGRNYGIPSDKQVLLLFDNNLELISKFTDNYGISLSFNGKELPHNYVNIIKKDKTQMVYSLQDKSFLEYWKF